MCNNLQSLKLELGRHDNACTGASLQAIASSCPYLRELCLHGMTYFPEKNMVALAAGCCELCSLHFGSTIWLSAAAIQAFASHCNHLVDISLPCMIETASVTALVSSCPLLRTADMPADDTVLVALAQHCPQLKELRVHHSWSDFDKPNPGLAGESLAALLQNCPELRQLTISDNFSPLPPSNGAACSVEILICSRATEPELRSLVQYMPHLRELHLGGHCKKLSGDIALAVADHCPHLEHVDLSRLDKETNASIIALTQGCPLLRKVDLRGCKLLQDSAVIALAQCCRLLCKIDLSDCTLLTDPAVIAIAKHCCRLLKVDFSSCTLLTDAAVVAIAKRCPCLQDVNLSGCILLTDAAVIASPSAVYT